MDSVYIILVLAGTILFKSEAKLLGLELDSPCPGGSCKLLSQCSTITNLRRSRPQICTFEGKIPVICCPNEEVTTTPTTTTTQRQQTTSLEIPQYNHPIFKSDSTAGLKAEEQCRGFINRLCSSSQITYIRRKRNVNYIRGMKFTPVVVNGQKAEPKDLAFMALLGYGEEGAQEWECGGSIISESWVLSAAHCNTHHRLGIAKWIRVGELDYSTDDDDANPLDLKIVRREIHPKYDEKSSLYNDIALFKTEYFLIFDAYVKPICLNTWLPKELNVTAAGWGTTGFGKPRSTSLQVVNLTLTESRICIEKYGRSKVLPNGIDRYTQICAGAPGKDTCTGDSGGPLFHDSAFDSCLRSQIGITSFGRRCGDKHPGVYTWTLLYTDWIESIVWPGINGGYDSREDIII